MDIESILQKVAGLRVSASPILFNSKDFNLLQIGSSCCMKLGHAGMGEKTYDSPMSPHPRNIMTSKSVLGKCPVSTTLLGAIFFFGS